MKVLRSVVLLITIFAFAYAYPASETEKASTTTSHASSTKTEETIPPVESEIDFVPLEEQRPNAPFSPNGVIDVDANTGSFAGNPFYDNPFPSLFDSFNALMYRMRQQLGQLLGRLPERPPFTELHIPNVGNIDLGKGNTTSVTKIVDGHKITINETEYKQEENNGGSYFKVRIIDVHPDSAEGTDKSAEGPKKDRESMEYSDISNEITKVIDNEALKTANIEMFDEIDAADHHTTHTRSNGHWGNTRPLENIEDNSIINSELVPPPDLSNDIYVNQLLLDSGAPTNPDAEVFEVLNGQVPPQVPRKTVAFNYLPPQKDDINTNEPLSDFSRMGIQPAFPNMAFAPRPMFPINHGVPNMSPNDLYVRQPNFPIYQPQFLPNQMYFPQHAPFEQNFPSNPNFEHVQPSNQQIVGLKGTTQINEQSSSTSNVPVSTANGANPSSTS